MSWVVHFSNMPHTHWIRVQLVMMGAEQLPLLFRGDRVVGCDNVDVHTCVLIFGDKSQDDRRNCFLDPYTKL